MSELLTAQYWRSEYECHIFISPINAVHFWPKKIAFHVGIKWNWTILLSENFICLWKQQIANTHYLLDKNYYFVKKPMNIIAYPIYLSSICHYFPCRQSSCCSLPTHPPQPPSGESNKKNNIALLFPHFHQTNTPSTSPILPYGVRVSKQRSIVYDFDDKLCDSPGPGYAASVLVAHWNTGFHTHSSRCILYVSYWKWKRGGTVFGLLSFHIRGWLFRGSANAANIRRPKWQKRRKLSENIILNILKTEDVTLCCYLVTFYA